MTADDRELVARYPGVALDHTNKDFYRGLLDQELRLNRCSDCGWWHHRPKPICPRCWSKALVATPVSGRGVIHLAIFLHQGPPAPDVDYAAGPRPVVTVELEEQEGLRFTSTVVDATREDIVIGAPVQLAWVRRGDRSLPMFRLSSTR